MGDYETHQLSPAELENVKHVIFGLQKQASVQNDAVCIIISREITKHMTASALETQDSFIEACKEYIQRCIDGKIEPDENAFMLLCGKDSLSALGVPGPRVVDIIQPSIESPKLLFRVGKLGETAHTALSGDTSANAHEADTTSSVDSTSTHREIDVHINETDSFAVKAEKLKNLILPCVPEAVKTEIPDNEYAQALVCAEAYFDFK